MINMALRLFFVLLGALNVLANQGLESENSSELEQSYEEIALGEYPWFGRFERNGTIIRGCAATLIDLSHALTIPTCLKSEDLPSHIIFGDWSTDNEIDPQCNGCPPLRQRIAIDYIITHPEQKVFLNDIAIVKLAKNVQLTPNVVPIRMHSTDDEIPANSVLQLTGYVRETSVAPWKTYAIVQDLHECDRFFLQNKLSSNQLCATTDKSLGFRSGSALTDVYGEPGARRHHLVAIFDTDVDSLTDENLNNNIFTLVAPHRDWILENI